MRAGWRAVPARGRGGFDGRVGDLLGLALALALAGGLVHAGAARAQPAPPGLDAAGQALWAGFLARNLPRAAASSPDGHLGWHAGGDPAEAMERALGNCRAAGGTGCAPWAMGLDVVRPGREWRAPRPPGPLRSTWNWSLVPDDRYAWHGPEAAAGAVVWMGGRGGGAVPGLQPAPLVRAFADAGFDVLRLDREPAADDRDRAAGWLREALVLLRARGWARLVVVGQSRGGWNALQALDTPGLLDVAIALSPAAQGTAGGASAPGESGGGLNLGAQDDELRRVVAAVPASGARLAVAQFADDLFMGDAAVRVRLLERLRPRLGALLLLDRPAGLSGHGAGEGAAFAQRFAACLLRFATAPAPPSGCDRA